MIKLLILFLIVIFLTEKLEIIDGMQHQWEIGESSNPQTSTDTEMKFSLVELTVLVHALRYVDFQYVNILPNFDKLDIFYYGLYEGFNKDENIFNYPIVKQTFVKLRQVINHYDNLIPKPVILGYADFARTNNQLMYFQNYIIRKALIEMFERNPEEYDSFIKTWRIEPHGNDKNPEAVMGVVGTLSGDPRIQLCTECKNILRNSQREKNFSIILHLFAFARNLIRQLILSYYEHYNSISLYIRIDDVPKIEKKISVMQYFEAYDHLEVKSIFWINRMNQMACLNDLPKEPLQKLETELSNNIYNAKLAIGELATAAYLERFIPLIYSYIVDIDRDKNEACKEYNYFYQILQNFNENALNFYDIYGLMNDKNKRSFEFYFARQLIKEFREERNYHSGIVDEENPVYLPQPHIKLVNNIYEKCNGGH